MNKRHEAALKVKPIYAKGAQSVEDSEALKVKGIYYTWEELLDENHEFHKVKKGFKFRHGNTLYKTEQPEYTFVTHYVPGAVGTESLFTVINETHAGTISDPIPAVSGMEYEYGLYYLDPEDGNIYLCQRQDEPIGGKITLYALPHNLVGNYFELYLPDDKGYSGLLEEE